jgi:hypothetical protein
MNLDNFPNVAFVLEKYGTRNVNEMITRLKTADKVATGNLIKSLLYKIEDTDNGSFELVYEANDYAEYIDKGVNGTQRNNGSPYSYKNKLPPIFNIIHWCNVRGIPKGAAYAIQWSIFERGFKPVSFFNRTVNKTLKAFQDELESAYAIDIENMI